MAIVKIPSAYSPFVANQADTTYVLDAASKISTSGSHGIDGTAGAENQTYLINGTIRGETINTYGIQVGTWGSPENRADNSVITIGETALIDVVDCAVVAYGNNVTITNNGVITGDQSIESNGLAITGEGGKITNTGLISAHYGITFSESGGTFVNSGHILSAIGVSVDTDTGEKARIVNSGDLTGDEKAINGDAGQETVVNSGQIHGDIWLLGGNDMFVSRGGHMSGAVHGGLGDDTYVVDNKLADLTENTGEGFDRVRSSVSWTLGANFEEATLTGKKNINLTGHDGGSMLYGNAGNNKIIGDMGADFITGGRGNDTLTGGDGINAGDIGDTFIFRNHSGRDIITDFQDGMDKISVNSYNGIEGFADLSGHIKQSGDDVVITLLDGDRITLHGMDKADISALDFQF